jgi:ribosomal protein L21
MQLFGNSTSQYSLLTDEEQDQQVDVASILVIDANTKEQSTKSLQVTKYSSDMESQLAQNKIDSFLYILKRSYRKGKR